MTSEVAFRLAFPQATLGTRSGLLLIFPCVLSDEKGEAEGERGGGSGRKEKGHDYENFMLRYFMAVSGSRGWMGKFSIIKPPPPLLYTCVAVKCDWIFTRN